MGAIKVRSSLERPGAKRMNASPGRALRSHNEASGAALS